MNMKGILEGLRQSEPQRPDARESNIAGPGAERSSAERLHSEPTQEVACGSFLGIAKRLPHFHGEELQIRKGVLPIKSVAKKIHIKLSTRWLPDLEQRSSLQVLQSDSDGTYLENAEEQLVVCLPCPLPIKRPQYGPRYNIITNLNSNDLPCQVSI
jgi:hypothetical protein